MYFYVFCFFKEFNKEEQNMKHTIYRLFFNLIFINSLNPHMLLLAALKHMSRFAGCQPHYINYIYIYISSLSVYLLCVCKMDPQINPHPIYGTAARRDPISCSQQTYTRKTQTQTYTSLFGQYL